MADQHTSKAPESPTSPALSRRHFLQGTGLTAAGVFGLLQGHPAHGAPAASGASPRALRSRPNFLILMVDEMRYPPIYESASTKAFRQQYLLTQNLLRQHGVEFHRHYAASVACSPSRASLYTGHYPSLHGVTETTGAAKEAFDPDVFWLDPNSVPTFGDYFRAAGKPPAEWQVGIEQEKLGVRSDGSPVPYEGETGIAEILRRLVPRGFAPTLEDGHIIALDRKGERITTFSAGMPK